MGAHVDGILLIFGLSALAGLIFTGKIIDSQLRKMVLASLAIFSIVSLFLGLFSYTPAILIVGSAVWGVTFGGAATLLNTALADAAEDGADVAISMTVVSWNAAIATGDYRRNYPSGTRRQWFALGHSDTGHWSVF